MDVALVILLSLSFGHVSAGGVYCARAAQRAHSAADYGPLPSRPRAYNVNDHGWGAVRPRMASHGQNHPGVKSVGDTVHKQAHPRAPESTLSQSRGTSTSVQSQHAAGPVPRLPRGRSFINPNSYFEEFKPAAPPGQLSTASWDPQGQTQPGSFVYRKHGPNRHGVFGRRFAVPRSWSHGPYQRGFTGYGPGPEAAVPRSGVPAMSHSPVGRMKNIWVPTMNVKQFGQEIPVIKHFV